MNHIINIEYIKSYAIDFGYECLSPKYTYAKKKLKFRCNEGHIYEGTWNHFQQGRRCPICLGRNKTMESVRLDFLREGHILVSTEYSYNKKLDVQCPVGHIFQTTYDNFFNRKRRCYFCYVDRMRDRHGSKNPMWRKYTEEEYKKLKDYTLYVRQLSDLNYYKHRELINPNNLKRQRGEYSVDHMFSIKQAWINNIPPEIVSNSYNLQMMQEKENMFKKDMCTITKQLLYHIVVL